MRWQKTFQFFFRVLKSRVGSGGPLFLSHLVTTRCDCRCPTCLWKDHGSDNEVATEDIVAFYQQAGSTGFIANAIWGGEPLLRDDLEVLCRASREAGMVTSVITNGYYLLERAESLGPEIDSLIVSLDYPDAERHDAFRGRPGLFDRVIKGIEALSLHRRPNKVVINCLLHQGNQGVMPEMAALANSLGVSLFVCPAKAGIQPDTGQSNQDYILDREQEQHVARELLKLKKNTRINNSRTYLKRYLLKGQKYRCRAPLVFLTITSEGEAVNCLRKHRPYGNIREDSLISMMRHWNRSEILNRTEGCQKCNNPNVVDTSYLWDLYPEPLLNTIQLFLSS